MTITFNLDRDLSIGNPLQTTQMLAKANTILETLTAEQRIQWAIENLPGTHILSSSFGIQSAVMLHLMSRAKNDIPVVLIDTGYLFTETYAYIDSLVQHFSINLQVFRADISPAWQEARFGKLWEQGATGITKYNNINKVEPMQRALQELQVGSWFSGLRRSQADSRSTLPVLYLESHCYKINPLVDWSNQDIAQYMFMHDLPIHPLQEKNYVSVGDTHTSRPLEPNMREQDTRFFGIQRECGLHRRGDLAA